jgi:hypothetical protein
MKITDIDVDIETRQYFLKVALDNQITLEQAYALGLMFVRKLGDKYGETEFRDDDGCRAQSDALADDINPVPEGRGVSSIH